jgi:hypothetical protein
VEDIRQVAGDDAIADVKLLADVPVRLPLGHQHQHLELALGDPVGRFRPGLLCGQTL